MQTQVPQGLQALMALTQSMQSGQVQPMTRDGTPTVAGQAAQAAQQRMAPQPQMAPGMRPVAQQAAQGMQVGMHQQEQEQNRMKELLERMAQSRPDPAQQGIASAAPDMNFADGGIVGYAGGGEPDVDVRALDPDRMMQIIATAKNIPEDERQIVLERLRSMRGGDSGSVTLPSASALKAPPAPPPGGIAGDKPPSMSQRVYESQAKPVVNRLTEAKLDTRQQTPQEEIAGAKDEREAARAYLTSLGLPPDIFEAQQKATAERRAREQARQKEYDERRGQRGGIFAPGLGQALAAFATAPRRNAFAAMGNELSRQRSAEEAAHTSEMERRRKFEDDMAQVETLMAQGRIQEALAMRDKAAARFKAGVDAANKGMEFETGNLRALAGPLIQADTAAEQGTLNRAAELEKAKMQVNAQLQKIGPKDKQEEYLNELQKSYVLQLSKLDPNANADDYNRIRVSLIAVQQKLGELVGVDLAQPAVPPSSPPAGVKKPKFLNYE